MAIDINNMTIGMYCPLCSWSGSGVSVTRLVVALNFKTNEFKCKGNGTFIIHDVTLYNAMYNKIISANSLTPAVNCVFNIDEEDTKPIRKIVQSKVNEYPDSCLKCGKMCYIGFNMVDHADKGLNETCK